jgi:hypothetical protein
MIEYLEWLGECQSGNYTVKVKFTNLRQKNAIAEGKVELEDVNRLCSKLPSTAWGMQFDEHPGRVIKVEIDIEKNLVILTATLEMEDVG